MAFRVLVVDDASFVRETIKRHLRALIPDIELLEAPDGRKAMSIVKSKPVQLILSDWEMPEMSGEDFLKWLRSEPDYQSVPFVMVTSRGDRDHVVAAIQSGVSDYLSKPFTPEELQRKVAKQLKRIGYSRPKGAAPAPSSETSASILTGAAKKPVQKPREVRSATGFGKPKAAAPPAKKKGFAGAAVLRFPECQIECDIRELSLQAMQGFMGRPERMPGLFEQAAVDLEDEQGATLARLNAYVHALVAAEARPDSGQIRITVRFVDNDPEKFEVLSKLIAAG